MPRLGRLHIVGGCYHVMGRGLERRRVFNRDVDKQDFLARLCEQLPVSQCECLAWAVMSNHYHLLIRVGSQPLSKLMSPLLGGYAGGYNRRHKRSGYVFQNRYKSILCDADNYLLELVRYIHLNPVRAGMVQGMSALDWYAWTGHAVVMDRRQQSWQNVDEVLRYFSKRGKTARERYRTFIQEGIGVKPDVDVSGGGLVRSYGGWEGLKQLRKDHIQRIGDERILGDSDFVEKALREDNLVLGKSAHWEREGWTLEYLIEAVCRFCDIDRDKISSKGRSNSLSVAKSLLCFWASSEIGLSHREIATQLKISQPAVSKSLKKGAHYCKEKGLVMGSL